MRPARAPLGQTLTQRMHEMQSSASVRVGALASIAPTGQELAQMPQPMQSVVAAGTGPAGLACL